MWKVPKYNNVTMTQIIIIKTVKLSSYVNIYTFHAHPQMDCTLSLMTDSVIISLHASICGIPQ